MKLGLAERLVSNGYMKAGELGNPLIVMLRMLSVPVVILCLRLRIHPNLITCLSLALGCAGAYLYFLGAMVSYLAAWSISVILDYADGTVARKSGKESHVGYLFDMLGDRVKLVALISSWCVVIGSMPAIVLAAVSISVLGVTEIVSHLLVRHGAVNPQTERHGAFFRMFLEFNMHSFFLYGISIVDGEGLSLLGNIWIAVVLVTNLGRECVWRMYSNGKFTFRINGRLLNR